MKQSLLALTTLSLAACATPYVPMPGVPSLVNPTPQPFHAVCTTVWVAAAVRGEAAYLPCLR